LVRSARVSEYARLLLVGGLLRQGQPPAIPCFRKWLSSEPISYIVYYIKCRHARPRVRVRGRFQR